MKRAAWLLLGLMVGGVGRGAGDPPRARFWRVEGRIRIGVLLPQRGPQAAEAEEIRRGLRLALRSLPARTPPIELLELNEGQPWGGDSGQVVRLAFEEPVAAVIAGVGGATSHLVEQIITKAWIPFLTPWASDYSLSRINIPWMFQVAPDDEAQTALLLRAARSLPLRSCAVVTASDFDSRKSGDTFARRAAPGREVVRLYFRHPRQFDLLLAPLRQAPPDAIFLTGPLSLTAQLAQRCARELPRTRLLFPLRLFQTAFLREAGAALEGSWFAGSPFCEAIPTPFHRRYRATYGQDATLPAALAYDSLQVLAAVLARNPRDRFAVRDLLQRTDWVGVTGPLRFDRAGRRTGGVKLWEVRGGKWEEVRQGAVQRTDGS